MKTVADEKARAARLMAEATIKLDAIADDLRRVLAENREALATYAAIMRKHIAALEGVSGGAAAPIAVTVFLDGIETSLCGDLQ